MTSLDISKRGTGNPVLVILCIYFFLSVIEMQIMTNTMRALLAIFTAEVDDIEEKKATVIIVSSYRTCASFSSSLADKQINSISSGAK